MAQDSIRELITGMPDISKLAFGIIVKNHADTILLGKDVFDQKFKDKVSGYGVMTNIHEYFETTAASDIPDTLNNLNLTGVVRIVKTFMEKPKMPPITVIKDINVNLDEMTKTQRQYIVIEKI